MPPWSRLCSRSWGAPVAGGGALPFGRAVHGQPGELDVHRCVSFPRGWAEPGGQREGESAGGGLGAGGRVCSSPGSCSRGVLELLGVKDLKTQPVVQVIDRCPCQAGRLEHNLTVCQLDLSLLSVQTCGLQASSVTHTLGPTGVRRGSLATDGALFDFYSLTPSLLFHFQGHRSPGD